MGMQKVTNKQAWRSDLILFPHRTWRLLEDSLRAAVGLEVIPNSLAGNEGKLVTGTLLIGRRILAIHSIALHQEAAVEPEINDRGFCNLHCKGCSE